MISILESLHPKRRIDSAWEEEELEKRIGELVQVGIVEEVAVERPEHPALEEHWYRDRESGEVYRYMPASFPARGKWEKVE